MFQISCSSILSKCWKLNYWNNSIGPSNSINSFCGRLRSKVIIDCLVIPLTGSIQVLSHLTKNIYTKIYDAVVDIYYITVNVWNISFCKDLMEIHVFPTSCLIWEILPNLSLFIEFQENGIEVLVTSRKCSK